MIGRGTTLNVSETVTEWCEAWGQAQEERGFGVPAGGGGAAEEEHRPGAVWGLVVEPGAESGTMSQSPMTPLQDQ